MDTAREAVRDTSQGSFWPGVMPAVRIAYLLGSSKGHQLGGLLLDDLTSLQGKHVQVHWLTLI